MGIFNKGGDVLDLTLLQKRGILKKQENKGLSCNVPDVIDLTKIPLENTIQPPSVQQSSSPFDFLSNLAHSSPSIQENTNQFEIPKTHSNQDLDDFKVKMDNLEYKLDRFLERLDKIEEKLSKS